MINYENKNNYVYKYDYLKQALYTCDLEFSN